MDVEDDRDQDGVGGAGGSVPAFRSLSWRAGDALVAALARLGVGPIHLLTTTGRRTGRAHTVPVVPVEVDGKTCLVAPYGTVGWVRNARASGRVSLRHGRTSRPYDVRELDPAEAGPVLKRYVTVATRTRRYFEATTASPVDAFVAEADRHPAFELVPPDPDAA